MLSSIKAQLCGTSSAVTQEPLEDSPWCKHITLKVTQTSMCLMACTSLGHSQGGSGEFLFSGGCRALAACAGIDQSCHAATSHLGSSCLLHQLQGWPGIPRDRRGGRRRAFFSESSADAQGSPSTSCSVPTALCRVCFPGGGI